ncbi:hypothetical protein DM860_017848 [Cuscuta australis]|uniref:Microtubule-associated protein MAP65-1a n=1 Tax=Cuscuta australis TaxID=267555 RepID=A0A328DQU0_9ASTE|nr:hypothetical protein DM860_017848 [Cuscuta australis]
MLTLESPCSTLLRELQQLWTEIGENEEEKDQMLMKLEKDCLEIYRRKVDETASAKARLHQSVAAKEAELATLMATLGELTINSPIQSAKKKEMALKDQLALISPLVEDLKVKKEERLKQFADVKTQMEKIRSEISGHAHNMINGVNSTLSLDENDLSLRRLSEHQFTLHALQKEKSERVQKVLEFVNEVHALCATLGVDFGETVSIVHPSLHDAGAEQSTNISNSTIEGLEKTIMRLKTERKERYEKLKKISDSLVELWNLMDTPREEKAYFLKVTSVIGSPETEIKEPGALSLDIIQQVLSEVERLTKLKASRMKELVVKKRSELEEICNKSHIEPDPSTAIDKSCAMMESGLVDPCELLANIEAQIHRAKDEALSRKDVTDRIERWLSACEEESWLEDYNQDQSRYSGGRGAHINLKRAERARITVNKIPGMVDSLIAKTLAWEDDKKKLFLYDGARLVSVLEDYKLTRQQKEEEKRRARDQKRAQDLLLAEKEAIYGSKPIPRSSSFRKGNGNVTPSPRRNSAGYQTPEISTPRSYSGQQNGHFRRLSTAPLNFVALAKDDMTGFSSVSGSEPESPLRH